MRPAPPSTPPAIGPILDQTASNEQRANFDLVHPDDRSRLNELLAAVIPNPSAPVGSEFRVLHRDGSTQWVVATASNFLDDPAVSAIAPILGVHVGRRGHQRQRCR